MDDGPYPMPSGNWRVPRVEGQFQSYVEAKAAAVKRNQLEAIVIEVETGLIDDEECNRKLDEIGATEDELCKIMGI